MSKIWFPKGARDYDITREQYFSAVWFIRDYDNMLEEAQDLLDQSPVQDGQPKGNTTSDPTAAAAERRENITRRIKCIEDALKVVPEEFRAILIENVAHQVPLYKCAPEAYLSDSGLQHWRVRFICEVALNREGRI